MSNFDANAVIERAKTLWGFKKDQDLAERLMVSRTTLASWRSRNSIPAKYLFKIVGGTDKTVDWLITGETVAIADDYGLAKVPPHVDDGIMWLAFLLYRRDLGEGNDHNREIAKLISDVDLSYFSLQVGNYITLMTQTKNKWEKSGIVKGKDIYRAIATEFDLGFFDFPPLPWWEDETII